MANRLTLWIVVGLVLGLAVGWGLHESIGDATPEGKAHLAEIARWFSVVTTIFLRLIKMIIAPLVLSTLIVGIAHMGDTGALGRVGLKSLGWFVTASLLSLTIGLVLVHLLQPGVGVQMPAAAAPSGIEHKAFDPVAFVGHVVPQSVFEALATNDILPIVVFAIFAGIAIAHLGDKARPLVVAAEALVQVMLRITNYVMRFAPFAVFAAVAAALAEQGPGVIVRLGYFIFSVYLGLAVLWTALIALAFLLIGRGVRRLLGLVRDPALLAFSTASSEAAFPRTLEALERFGVPPRIASFVLPLGYSFNLDGSMMYMTFASLFIAQAYGIHLSLGTQIAMLLTLMITSKGIAGVPRASLVVITATLTQFGIPEAGVLLILAVDHFLDMGRSATNVLGNAIAATLVARWEGQLDPEVAADPGG